MRRSKKGKWDPHALFQAKLIQSQLWAWFFCSLLPLQTLKLFAFEPWKGKWNPISTFNLSAQFSSARTHTNIDGQHPFEDWSNKSLKGRKRDGKNIFLTVQSGKINRKISFDALWSGTSRKKSLKTKEALKIDQPWEWNSISLISFPSARNKFSLESFDTKLLSIAKACTRKLVIKSRSI